MYKLFDILFQHAPQAVYALSLVWTGTVGLFIVTAAPSRLRRFNVKCPLRRNSKYLVQVFGSLSNNRTAISYLDSGSLNLQVEPLPFNSGLLEDGGGESKRLSILGEYGYDFP